MHVAWLLCATHMLTDVSQRWARVELIRRLVLVSRRQRHSGLPLLFTKPLSYEGVSQGESQASSCLFLSWFLRTKMEEAFRGWSQPAEGVVTAAHLRGLICFLSSSFVMVGIKPKVTSLSRTHQMKLEDENSWSMLWQQPWNRCRSKVSLVPRVCVLLAIMGQHL